MLNLSLIQANGTNKDSYRSNEFLHVEIVPTNLSCDCGSYKRVEYDKKYVDMFSFPSLTGSLLV